MNVVTPAATHGWVAFQYLSLLFLHFFWFNYNKRIILYHPRKVNVHISLQVFDFFISYRFLDFEW